MSLSAPIPKLKRKAKLISQREGIPLHQALDRVAAAEGYHSWSLLVARANFTAPGSPVETLDGWRQFKFGMTDEQARALPSPGKTWEYTPPETLIPWLWRGRPRHCSHLYSKGPIKEFGVEFDHAGFHFFSDRTLNEITLGKDEKEPTAEDFEKSFQKLVSNLETRYGSFEPGHIGVPDATIRNIPLAQSKYKYFYRYWLRRQGEFIGMAARCVIKGGHLEVSMSHSPKRSWRTRVQIISDCPLPPDAPSYQPSNGFIPPAND